jgi:hypothetical protein
MEKRATNTFVGGLVTDRHPLTSQNSELVEAQNIDLVSVGEGYQLILQKREGNEELLYGIQAPTGAGLPEGLIPLVVKEFNNLAYIISVDPETGKGEIGTFPSPDYAQFIYQKGNTIVSSPAIGSPTWDPRGDLPGYDFTITGIAGSGDDETINSNVAPYQLTKAGFTLTNTGTLSDDFKFATTSPGGVVIYVNGIIWTPATDVLTLGPGATAQIRFRHWFPFTEVGDLVYYPPNVLNNTTVTVTPLNDPTPTAKTYNYKFHISTMIGIRFAGTPPYVIAADFPYPLPINTHFPSKEIPAIGGYTQFEWVTNDSTLETPVVSYVVTPVQYMSDTYTLISNAIEVTMGTTVVPPAYRIGTLTYTRAYPATAGYGAGSVSLTLHVEQAIP